MKKEIIKKHESAIKAYETNSELISPELKELRKELKSIGNSEKNVAKLNRRSRQLDKAISKQSKSQNFSDSDTAEISLKINDLEQEILDLKIKVKKAQKLEKRIDKLQDKKYKGLVKHKDYLETELKKTEKKTNKSELALVKTKNEIFDIQYKEKLNKNAAKLQSKIEDKENKIDELLIINDNAKSSKSLTSSQKKTKIESNKLRISTIKLELVKLNKDYKHGQSFSEADKNKLAELKKLKKVQEKDFKEKEKISDDIFNLIEETNERISASIPEDAKDKSFIVKDLNVFYGSKQSLYDVNIEFPKNKAIAIIGPSGCGKSTFLKTLNRINDEIPAFSWNGEILLDGVYDIKTLTNKYNKYDTMELTELRTRVGMIFQQPNPFPMSIYKNVTYGPRINGEKNKVLLDAIAEKSLKEGAIWDEVKDNLGQIGTSLSGGQQQRLCIARAVANKPEILLMDEPTSALDPIAAAKIEDLIVELKKDYTIIFVTHSMQQAARISDYTAFFYEGELIEYGETQQIFTNPKKQKTEDYIRGKFG